MSCCCNPKRTLRKVLLRLICYINICVMSSTSFSQARKTNLTWHYFLFEQIQLNTLLNRSLISDTNSVISFLRYMKIEDVPYLQLHIFKRMNQLLQKGCEKCTFRQSMFFSIFALVKYANTLCMNEGEIFLVRLMLPCLKLANSLM